MSVKWTKSNQQVAIETGVGNIISLDYTTDKGNKIHSWMEEGEDISTVLALTKDLKVVMVKQYRSALDEEGWELPNGLCEPNEAPLDAGLRELKEETGYTLGSIGKSMLVRKVCPNPTHTTRYNHIIIAVGVELTDKQELDADESIEVGLFDIQEVFSMVLDDAHPNKIKHMFMTNAILIGLNFLKSVIMSDTDKKESNENKE